MEILPVSVLKNAVNQIQKWNIKCFPMKLRHLKLNSKQIQTLIFKNGGLLYRFGNLHYQCYQLIFIERNDSSLKVNMSLY